MGEKVKILKYFASTNILILTKLFLSLIIFQNITGTSSSEKKNLHVPKTLEVLNLSGGVSSQSEQSTQAQSLKNIEKSINSFAESSSGILFIIFLHINDKNQILEKIIATLISWFISLMITSQIKSCRDNC